MLAGILIKETFEPPYIAGNSAVLQTRASLPMLWIFNLFSLISCTLLFLVTVYDGCVWKKNVSLGKQLQFVNLKMLVLTHLSFYSHVPPHPHPLNYLGWGRGAESTVASGDTRYEMPPFKAEARGKWSRSTHRARSLPSPPHCFSGPWTDRQVSPGMQSLACRTSVAGWKDDLNA